MQLFIQTIMNGLILASVYILVSLGFALLFNTLGIFNIAHGSIFMTSAYLGFFVIVQLGFNQWTGFLLVILTMALLGVFLEKFCFRPFGDDFNRQIMIGVALTTVLTTTVNIGVGGSQSYTIPSFIKGALGSGAYLVSKERVLTFIIGAAILSLIVWFINHTRWGLQIQAVTQDREGAALQGIKIHRIAIIICSMGCGLAAVAGILVGSLYGLDPSMGDRTLIKILSLVILAGVGSFKGIYIVGLIMGMLYAGLPVLIPGSVSDSVAVTIVLLILLMRPRGFFGYEA